jgi:8-oxo-dGTP diphosphatase
MTDGSRTKIQVSAGGVAFRRRGWRTDVALVLVGEDGRWQLPKGVVGKGETLEETAVREVREEAGIETEVVGPIDRIDYWFFAPGGGQRLRVHKFVHFFLLRYLEGDVRDHDREVHEARWVPIGRAETMLAFESEKEIVRRARSLIEEAGKGPSPRGEAA